jgi:hypothetical protein
MAKKKSAIHVPFVLLPQGPEVDSTGTNQALDSGVTSCEPYLPNVLMPPSSKPSVTSGESKQ